MPQIKKTCEICGAPFEVGHWRENTARFCSNKCKGTWTMRTRKMSDAHKIGNKYRKGLIPTNAFTSETMSGNKHPSWVEPLEFTCLTCGKKFYKKPWWVRSVGTPKYCSHKCHGENNRGDKNPTWIGGTGKYRGYEWRGARAKVVRRDKGTCQDCGKVIGKSISVHHIKPYRVFDSPEAANTIDNLICLCQSCHMKRERN